MASATKRRENLLHSSWLVPRAQTLISAVERSSLISKARNIMRQLNSITNRFQSSIPQTRYQKKKRKKIPSRNSSLPFSLMSCIEGNESEASSVNAFAMKQFCGHFGEAWKNSLSQGNLLCETSRVSETTESHQTLSLTRGRCSRGLYSASFEITFAKAGAGDSQMGSALCPVDFSLEVSLSSGFKHVESQTCRGVPVLSLSVSTWKHQREGV